MIKGDYEFLKDIASRNVCARCKGELEVAWLGSENSYVLGCGDCGYIDLVTRQLSNTEEWKAGGLSPEEVVAEHNKERGGKSMSQEKQILPFELGGVPKVDLATGQLLAPEMIEALVEYAYKYHLDPERGHVLVMYGKPYIGIDGYLFHANRSRIPYALSSHPMTEDEKKDHMIPVEDHAWMAMVSFTGTDNAFSGIGIVSQQEMTAKSKSKPDQLRSPVVAAYPWQLAQKRAEWQVMRRAFPIGESEA